MIQIDGAPRICIWLHLIFSADFASPNMIKCGAWSTEPPRAGVSNNNLIFQEGINTAYSTGHQLWRPPLTSYWQTFIFPAETHLPFRLKYEAVWFNAIMQQGDGNSKSLQTSATLAWLQSLRQVASCRPEAELVDDRCWIVDRSWTSIISRSFVGIKSLSWLAALLSTNKKQLSF